MVLWNDKNRKAKPNPGRNISLVEIMEINETKEWIESQAALSKEDAE